MPGAASASPATKRPMCIIALFFESIAPWNPVGTDLVPQVAFREQRRIRIDLVVHRLEIARDGVEMRRLGGELQLSGAAEVAGDALLRDDRLDRVHGRVEGPVERLCAFFAEGGLRRDIAVGEAVVQMAAVAPGAAVADMLRLEQRHSRTRPSPAAGRPRGR